MTTRTIADVINYVTDMAMTGLTITQHTDPLWSPSDPYTDHREYVMGAAGQHLGRLPARFRLALLEDLTTAQAPDLLRAWLDRPDAETLLLSGAIGTGKTYAAAAVATAYAARSLRTAPTVAPVRWWSVAILLDALRPSASRDPEKVWQEATSAPLLVLDDLAHVRATDWAAETLWRLANVRSEVAGCRTVVTMNAVWADLEATWGVGTMDRLKQNAVPVTITGPSRRTLLTLDGRS